LCYEGISRAHVDVQMDASAVTVFGCNRCIVLMCNRHINMCLTLTRGLQIRDVRASDAILHILAHAIMHHWLRHVHGKVCVKNMQTQMRDEKFATRQWIGLPFPDLGSIFLSARHASYCTGSSGSWMHPRICGNATVDAVSLHVVIEIKAR